MFEPIWNRRYIDHVQITAAETVGVERRASYYEGAGALRDMVQNHLMQLLALVAMEPPTEFTRRQRARPEDGRAARGAAARRRRHRSRRRSCARNIATGWVERRKCPPIARAGGRARLDDRNLRRDAAEPGQLAMGRRAVLSPHRQTAAEAHHRDRHPVQSAAAADFQAGQPDPAAVRPAGHQRAAGRGHLAAVQREDSRRPACRLRR